MGTKFVAYVRVSTDKQGRSGLGLEAQQTAVTQYVARDGGAIVAEYREVESGKSTTRPQLLAALAHCRMAKATLLIAKLDRLARNVHFFSGLMESDVPFVAADQPNANRFTLHIHAAVAENDARAGSDRTKAALAARKARGGTLGVHCLSRAGIPIGQLIPRESKLKNLEAAREAKSKKAGAAYADYLGILRDWKAAGISTRRMAEELNDRGYTTRTGKPWNHVQVGRVLSMEEAS